MSKMERSAFIASAAIAVVAVAAASRNLAAPVDAADIESLPLGVARRFPGYALQCFEDPDGEVYLAYSAEAILRECEMLGNRYEPEQLQVLAHNTIVTNAQDGVVCDGRCRERGNPAGGHECFVPRRVIEEWVDAIDSGRVERNHDAYIASVMTHRRRVLEQSGSSFVGSAITEEPNHNLDPWHPSRAGIVDCLWTTYA
jgi:hypothetical protein